MIRGTTPTHIFNLSIEASQIQSLRITYRQLGYKVLEKTEVDVTATGNMLKFTLTQEESLNFRPRINVDIQLKALLTNGIVVASPIIHMSVDKILNEEVLT